MDIQGYLLHKYRYIKDFVPEILTALIKCTFVNTSVVMSRQLTEKDYNTWYFRELPLSVRQCNSSHNSPASRENTQWMYSSCPVWKNVERLVAWQFAYQLSYSSNCAALVWGLQSCGVNRSDDVNVNSPTLNTQTAVDITWTLKASDKPNRLSTNTIFPNTDTKDE